MHVLLLERRNFMLFLGFRICMSFDIRLNGSCNPPVFNSLNNSLVRSGF